MNDPRDQIDHRHQEMKRERIVAYSKNLGRWCICNGFATVLATAPTREEAQALAGQPLTAEQLPLF